MADNYALDDAAAAALWRLINEPVEHIGLLYADGNGIAATPTQSQSQDARTKGTFAIPPGSLRGLYHNHPLHESKRRKTDVSELRDRQRASFSRDDITQAKRLGVPSYISAGHALKRYDPQTGQTSDVLAQVPIDEIRSYLMRRFFPSEAQ